MLKKMWNWLIALGAFVSFVGLLFLPSALSGHNGDDGLLAAGFAIFSTGALLVAVSLYFQARTLRAEIQADPSLAALLNGKRRKTNCDSCHAGAPVVQCTMHRLSLCANCLSQHYDSRACVYVPSVRRPVGKSRGASVGRA